MTPVGRPPGATSTRPQTRSRSVRRRLYMFVRLCMTYHSVYNYFLLMYFMSYVSIKFYIVFVGGSL